MAFEALLAQQAAKPNRRQRITLIASLAVHGAALAAGVAHSMWRVDELPLPAVHVTLATAAPPPPPPPPPPPAAQKQVESKPKAKKVVERKPEVIVEPKEKPEPEEPEAEEAEADESGAETAEEGGQAGGVVGGVAGGVAGGVVGSPEPPPPPKPSGPKIVSASVARGQLLIDPNAEPYRVTLPRMLARSGTSHFAVVRMCVSARGTVDDVRIVRSAGPAIDPQIPTVLGRWRYRPVLLDGRPTAFCYMLRYEISAR